MVSTATCAQDRSTALSKRGQHTTPGHQPGSPVGQTSSAFGQFSRVTCLPDLGLDADPEPWAGDGLHWWEQPGPEPGGA